MATRPAHDMRVGIALELDDRIGAVADPCGQPDLADAAADLVGVDAGFVGEGRQRRAQIDDIAVAVFPLVEEGKVVADRLNGRHAQDIGAANTEVTKKGLHVVLNCCESRLLVTAYRQHAFTSGGVHEGFGEAFECSGCLRSVAFVQRSRRLGSIGPEQGRANQREHGADAGLSRPAAGSSGKARRAEVGDRQAAEHRVARYRRHGLRRSRCLWRRRGNRSCHAEYRPPCG